MAHSQQTIMALDVGSKRIGVALANSETRFPQAHVTLANAVTFQKELDAIIEQHNVVSIVVGLPRGLDGQVTQQTRDTKAFATSLAQNIHLPIHFQDEAVTSRQAEAELRDRGKPFRNEDIDSLAAVYILEDFLQDGSEGSDEEV